MSRKRRDPRNARLRRDRIRREKHVQRMGEAPAPMLEQPYAMERMLRRFEVLAEQQPNPEEPVRAGPEELASVDAAKQDDRKWRAQELACDAKESEDLGEAMELVDKALDRLQPRRLVAIADRTLLESGAADRVKDWTLPRPTAGKSAGRAAARRRRPRP